MGVIGWPPETVRRARLADLADAMEGYRGAGDGISAAFLTQMMQKFPDRHKDNDT
jgi:hypothetical protein